MANVKITDLTALSASDSADADVFVVVDVDADETKKMTKAEAVTALSAANDFATTSPVGYILDVFEILIIPLFKEY